MREGVRGEGDEQAGGGTGQLRGESAGDGGREGRGLLARRSGVLTGRFLVSLLAPVGEFVVVGVVESVFVVVQRV